MTRRPGASPRQGRSRTGGSLAILRCLGLSLVLAAAAASAEVEVRRVAVAEGDTVHLLPAERHPAHDDSRDSLMVEIRRYSAMIESMRDSLTDRNLGISLTDDQKEMIRDNIDEISLVIERIAAEVSQLEFEIHDNRISLLNARHFEGNELGLVPSLMKRAAWQHRARHYNDERVTYRRVIRIIETYLSKDAVELVDPLRRLGESFYYFDPMGDTRNVQPTPMSGESYLRRAVRIAENAEDYPWHELATTRLALADYYNFLDSQTRARKAYLEVWESLSEGEEQLQARWELLEQPVALRVGPLPRFVNGQSSDAPVTTDFSVGTVAVEYTVSPNGRVRNIRSRVTPPEFSDMQRTVHREMRRRVFRPKLVEGEPVTSDMLNFEHQFYYRQADLDELRKAPDESES